ncbi:MAG: ABC transporter ATP-binding protein [Acidimicrobiales bacterium]|jgi:peptide/nickel transport system ATP-binding protein
MSKKKLSSTVLEVENLSVRFGDVSTGRDVVTGISFHVGAGECLGIVGESGSGKSVTARTLVGLTGRNSHVSAERLTLHGENILGLSDRKWRNLRGKQIGFILQDALVSLDPLRPVGKEIAEALRLHHWGTRAQRYERVIELLRQVGVPEPEVRARQRPGELSGGLRQRALIASAIALDPTLVIADEPTTALDVTVQAQVLDLLEEIKRRGDALILISHDLAVVSRLADRVVVMNAGVIVEQGPTSQVLHRPRHDYTRKLLAAIPSSHPRGTRLMVADPDATSVAIARPTQVALPRGERVLSAEHLTKRFRGPDGMTRTVVSDVSLHLDAGETLGIVGESGSGKTTTARMVLALTEPDGGRVLLRGEPWSELPERERRSRRRQISVIYQDPLSSFDPRWSVERVVNDALSVEDYPTTQARRKRTNELLGEVGLSREHFERRPLQLSGGQRQRVAIARALAPEPAVVVCDEPVSALDVSIQAQVLDLLCDLQDQLGVSYLFISHDLGVVQHLSDRVVVMKDGVVVEQGTASSVFEHPQHDYTRQLLRALPTLNVVPDDVEPIDQLKIEWLSVG